MTPEQFKVVPLGTIVKLEYNRMGTIYTSIWVVVPDTCEGYRDLLMVYGNDDVYDLGEIEPVEIASSLIPNYTLYDP